MVQRSIQKGSIVIQLWGDLSGGRRKDLIWLPKKSPPKGHMGYLLSDVSPEPAIRMAVAGLKVGEILARSRQKGLTTKQAIREAVRSGFALQP